MHFQETRLEGERRATELRGIKKHLDGGKARQVDAALSPTEDLPRWRVFLLLVLEKNPKIVPSTDSLQCPVGQLMGTEGGGGRECVLALEASMLVLRSLMSFITGRVQAVAQAFLAHFIARQLFAVQDA